ncbi:MAG TPA: FliM/FliN family flagellar motor switch protein [Planctomycetes bacterium]|nr:FliM/FliN family flagellar motor switch protein [Planctomycetota bacterium]
MTENVEPEEAEAIQAALASTDAAEPAVVERDFSRPVRLSSEELEEVERSIASLVPDIERAMAETIGSVVPLELTSVAESSATDLFGEEETGPLTALRFEVHGQPAWVLWDNVAAVRTVESILGSHADIDEPRRMTPIEEEVLQSLLLPVAHSVLAAIGAEGGNVSVAQSNEALGSWEDAGECADPYRLHVAFGIEDSESPSVIDCYIPIDPPGRSAASEGPIELPAHLDRVTVEVSARIQGSEIPLEQLLQLEPGDVIPLDAKVGEPATLCVEGKPHAAGVLGTHQGLVALRIEHLIEEGEANHE